jgi:hypothetical protein
MLIFTKFIALTSAFSLVGGLLIDLCWILIARMGVIVGVIYSLRGWLLLCSLFVLSIMAYPHHATLDADG